jgi:glycosyltransferase involved in cell wall biosynthesis
MPLVVLHIIPTMGQGGAERLLHALASVPAEGQRHIVLTLFDEVLFGDGVDIRTLGLARRQRLRSSMRFALAWRSIRSIIRDENVGIVHGWLYYGILATIFARPHVDKVVWSIHNTLMPATGRYTALHLAERGCARLSYSVPDRIIYCAEAARAAHDAAGYRRDAGIVLDNGVDVERFCYPGPEAVRAKRRRLGFADDDEIVGIFARFHPQKDLTNSFAAIAECVRTRPNLKVLLAGAGMSPDNSELNRSLERAGLAQRATCIGIRDDMEEVINAASLIVSGSAYGEAMPMVVLEALSCGVPVAATDVGDVSRLDMPRSAIVPPSEPHALAGAISAGLDQGRDDALWRNASARTRTRFSIGAYRAAHASFYRSLR